MRTASDAAGIRFGLGLEAAGWFMALLLGALAFLLPQAAGADRQPKLLAVVATLAIANLLLHRVMPDASDGPIRFAREDKALVVSLAMVLLLTGYLFILPESAGALAYLYLIPLFASTLVLHEHVVLAEAVFSLLAMLFLRASAWIRGPFWEGDFALRIMVFAAASICLVLVTRALRLAFVRADRLSGELSIRLDQLQVINTLVRQSEYTTQIGRLAARTGSIVADAVDAERHALFVIGPDGKRLTRVGEGAGEDFYDDDLMSVEENLQILRGVLETGTPRVFAEGPDGVDRFVGNAHIRNMLAMPLRVRDASIGVLCLVNRRASSGFSEEDVNYCGLLAGFVATLLNAALLFDRTVEERKTVERMAKLMVGREIRMRELKGRAAAKDL